VIFFFQIGLLLETHFDCFEKMKYPKEMAIFWATFTLITVLKFKKLWLHSNKSGAFLNLLVTLIVALKGLGYCDTDFFNY
jgi:hypothetical protein